MAVTITDRRTTVNDAQSTTNWSGVGYGTTTVSAEDTLAVAESLAITSGAMYFTQPSGTVSLGTSPGTLVYVWSFNNALQDAWDASPPPNALLLGDGTDRIAFDMAGADKRVFNHLTGPTGLDCNSWQCLVLDTGQASTMNSAGNTYVVAGSFAALDFGNITQWGVHHDTNSKALGGGYNVACDIIRYGNDGIRITGGGSGTQGTFLEIATADRSRSADAAHGILRELGTSLYGCQGPLTFGDSGGTDTNYFRDSGIVLSYEDRNISDGKYYLNVEGNSTGTNSFVLLGSTISTGGPSVSLDASGGNLNTLTITNCVFVNLANTITFSSAADASGHSVTGSTFDGCDTVDAGNVADFTGNSILNSVADPYALTVGTADCTDLTISGYEGTAGTAAIDYNVAADPDGELDNLRITKGTAATHAIELGTNTPTSITLRGWTTSGYNAANGNNDSTIYNNSNKSITVNVIGGSGNFTYRNGGSSTTSVVISPVTLTIEVVDINTGSPIVGARVWVPVTSAAGGYPYNAAVTSITSSGAVATVSHTAHSMATNDWVDINGVTNDELYNGTFQITVSDANTYTYTMAGTPSGSPATGSPTATFVVIMGTTNGSGIIAATYSYSAAQPVGGRVRSASAGPYYKTAPISGTISSTAGLSVTVQMITDQ
jgi:hypothetical protein